MGHRIYKIHRHHARHQRKLIKKGTKHAKNYYFQNRIGSTLYPVVPNTIGGINKQEIMQFPGI